ncbi:hypothetical protein CUMW_182040, partial [Citrus unshiu]
ALERLGFIKRPAASNATGVGACRPNNRVHRGSGSRLAPAAESGDHPLLTWRHAAQVKPAVKSFNGTIPATLAQCTLLRAVFLQYNSLSGNLPQISVTSLILKYSTLQQTVSREKLQTISREILNLSSNGFSGPIPTSISNLSQLQLINFSFNKFSRVRFRRPSYLWLDFNLLEGTLPSAIANCSSLVHLSAQGNALGGVIPPAIGALPKLQVVSLAQNNLSGVVPASMFCNVSGYPPSIRVVQLGFNAFTNVAGPETGSCSSVLQVLDLQQNQIRGAFPLWLTHASTLTRLDVSGNSISGKIPAQIGGLWRLEELKMANNSFGGAVPVEIKQCSSLSLLDLEGNRFSGEIPEFLGDIRGLKSLTLAANLFSGSIPASFRNLPGLENLNLRHNSLSGSLPEEVLGMNNLSTLDLSENKFSGEVPASIGNLSQLMVFNLSGNAFSGRIPASLGNLLKLTTLDLSKQNFSGELPIELAGLPNLQVIALQENKLSGNVSEGFSSLMSLRYLNLSFNGFVGQIPATFSFLRSVVVLSFSGNHISGSIPPELGNCSDLEVLELRSNSLTGHIPTDISHLSHLNVLDLSINNLTGEIPDEISKCSSLRSLLVNSNHLSGGILDSLAKLSNLTVLDLSANNLSGEIPANLSSIFGLMNFNVSSNNLQAFANNQDLCGKPLGRKCENADDRDRRKKLILLIVIAASGACLLALCCCFYIFSLLRWRRRLKESAAAEKKRSPARASSGASGGRRSSTDNGGPKLVMFNNKITLAETVEATRQFDEENVLSRTRYGLVFKACYNDGMVLSIRRLPDGSLDENLFRKEAEFLGKVRHRNLTVLRGYYAGAPDLRLLVYDYMPNGNLGTLLQEASHQDGHVLNWPMRHLIALGVARGLAFLHTSNMVHVLLELLTGKRPVMFTQDEDIVKWVKKQLQKGQITELLEPGLLELDPESSEWEEFLLGVKVALLCTAPDPIDRPTMSDIVFMLEGCRVGPDIPSSADPTTQPSPA